LTFLLALLVTTPTVEQPAPQVFRTSTRVVTIDALVHGKDGQPIRNLTANDFRLFEDGKEQRIEFFSVVSADGGPVSARVAPQPMTPGTFTNRPGGSIPTTATVVLFDRLNTRFEDQVPARNQIVKFLENLRTNDRIALYVLESNEVRVLHDFSHDAASLIATIKRYRAGTSIEQAVTDTPVPELAPSGATAVDADMQAWLLETTRMIDAEFTRRRVQITLSAIEMIAHHLSGIPGRKNLVWVSSGFPLIIADRFGPQTMSNEVSRAVQAVNSSHLSIYPIDARGLVAPYSGPGATATYQAIGRGGAPPPPPPVSTVIQPNIDAMTELAARTGGRAFFDTNDIGRAIERAIDDASVTYLLGYAPANDNWNGKFRKLRVTVRAPDAEVRHRTGYLAIPQAAVRGNDRMTDLARASLESTGIGLTASLVARELTTRVEPGAITLTANGEMWDATLDILIVETAKGGELIKHLDRTLNLRLNRAQRDELMREGFSMTRTIERRSGDSQVHIVVRDAPSGVAGSVRITR
jgi:VWFA-related protein